MRVLPQIERLDDCLGDFLVRVSCPCGASRHIEPEALARIPEPNHRRSAATKRPVMRGPGHSTQLRSYGSSRQRSGRRYPNTYSHTRLPTLFRRPGLRS